MQQQKYVTISFLIKEVWQPVHGEHQAEHRWQRGGDCQEVYSPSHHQWCLLWFENPQECGESRQSVHAGQEPANQAGHQGGPVWTLLVKHQPLTQPLFMGGSLRPMSKIILLNAGLTGQLVFLLSGKIQLDLGVWTHSYSVHWCYGLVKDIELFM